MNYNIPDKENREFGTFVEFSINLTTKCNWNCSYCNQNSNHKNDDKLSFGIYKLLIKKILKEFHKSGIKYCSLSLLGGELSIDMDYINYFKFLLQEVKQYDIILDMDLITNFSGNKDFFEEFLKLSKIYNKHHFIITCTLHEEYYQNKESLLKIITKANQLNLENYNVNIDFKYLISDSPKSIKLQKLLKEKDIKRKILKNKFINLQTDYLIDPVFKNYNYGKKLKTREYFLCDALFYRFSNNKIVDICRKKEYSFINFRIDKTLINCNRDCPCSHLPSTFNTRIKQNKITKEI